jgi:type II secretory pathway component PulF
MARFRYAALTPAGRTRRGLLEAESRDDALRALAARGETAVELALARPGLLGGLLGGATGIGRDELAAFLADLAALNDAGVPLRKGLDVLSGEASTPRAARLARLIAERLDAGSDFGRAARVEEGGDLALAAELVRAGEASGRLSDALRFAADLLRRQSEFARRIASALAYPAFLLALSIAALIALAAFAGPAIAPLLAETPDGSPTLSAVIAAGETLRRHGVEILAGVVLAVAALVWGSRRDSARRSLAAVRARLPIFGAIVRDLNCGAFARALGAMLSGGAPAGTAFDLAAATAPNSDWRARFLGAGESMRDGRTVAAALASINGASPELARLARVGEESGALGEMLNRAGDLAVERALRRLDRIAAAAGPALILAMGGFTGWLMSAFLGGLSQLGEGVL